MISSLYSVCFQIRIKRSSQKGLVFVENGAVEAKINVEENRVEKAESKIYTHEEAFEGSLKYFNGDELAARVWINKYALKDSFGNIYESPRKNHRFY